MKLTWILKRGDGRAPLAALAMTGSLVGRAPLAALAMTGSLVGRAPLAALAMTALLLNACAAKQTTPTAETQPVAAPARVPAAEKLQADTNTPCTRYLAWLQGDANSDYEPYRDVAEARLAQWEGKVPEATDTQAYLNYLSVLDASGRAMEAEKKLKAYLAEHPGEKRGIFLLGVHYMRARKKDLANYFFAQLEKDESFQWKSLLFNNLAMLALQEKNRLAAITYLEKAVKSEPATAAPFVNLGALYLQSRSFPDAEKLFSRAQDIDGDMEDAALGRGSALEGMGKFEDAHKVYADFMNGHPDALSVLYNDSIILGNRLKQRDTAAQQMLRYIQRGGKEMAKAHDIIQGWR